jgi:allophanate hydrolase
VWFAGDAAAAAAHEAALAAMRDRGWHLVEVDLDPFRAAGELLYGGAFVSERYAAVGRFVDEAGPGDGLDPVVAAVISGAADVPAWRAFADIDRLRAARAETGPTWDGVDGADGIDALALPVVPTTVTHRAVAADPHSTNQVLGTYTTFANLLDLCAAVTPVAARADGHPWAVQLLGPAFADGVVAALAHELGTAAARADGAGGWAAAAAAVGGPAPPSTVAVPDGRVALVVAGAHLRGEALDHQVVDCGGEWLATTRTAPVYALHLVADSPPRPGLVRTAGPGAAIEVDVWALPPEGWARFVAQGVPGLAVGRVELADGTVRPGFVAAADQAADQAAGLPDLTPWGGWRAWRAAGSPVRPAAADGAVTPTG